MSVRERGDIPLEITAQGYLKVLRFFGLSADQGSWTAAQIRACYKAEGTEGPELPAYKVVAASVGVTEMEAHDAIEFILNADAVLELQSAKGEPQWGTPEFLDNFTQREIVDKVRRTGSFEIPS